MKNNLDIVPIAAHMSLLISFRLSLQRIHMKEEFGNIVGIKRGVNANVLFELENMLASKMPSSSTPKTVAMDPMLSFDCGIYTTNVAIPLAWTSTLQSYL